MKKKKILIFGNYGGQNWGDEMILSGLLSVIPKNIFEVTVVSSDPEFTKKNHKIDAVFPPPAGFRSLFRAKSFEIFKKLQSTDFIFLGGGGLLQNREKKAIFLWSFYVFLARLFCKKIFFVGNSLGPFSGFFAEKLAKNSLQGIQFFSSRDEASQDFLEKWNLEKISILATDAAFLLPKFSSKKKQRRGTIIALRGDGNISPQKIKSLFSSLPKPITAIAMDRIDENFAQKLGVKILSPKSISEVKEIFASARFVLSSRLHGGILSFCAETPFLCFSAAPKVKNFFAERGMADVVFSENFSKKKVLEKVTEILKQKNILGKKRLEEKKRAKNILPIFFQKG